eukprot:SAG22_NODE_406_length_10984_cov_28.344970_15_plen_281_part_00
MAMLMSSAGSHAVAADAATNSSAATLHFAGIKILEAAITKLGTLGLAKAERVILHGIAHGGTAAILHADRVAALVKKVAPGLAAFKALPVDGIHPKFGSMIFAGSHDTWYTGALTALAKIANIKPAVAPGCASAHAADVGQCLYANETLPFVETPVFAVQQMPGVWDYQCMYEGIPNGNILQIGCSCRTRSCGGLSKYHCVQYPDLCDGGTVESFTIPLQQAYLQNFATVGVKPGNGGFFFSCYLGAYFNSNFASTAPAQVPRPMDGIWNQIEVGGKVRE